MAWVYLFFAGLLEVIWASTMKQSEGFTKLTPAIITVVAILASLWLLGLAMKTLPLGTAYAIWTGVGAVGAFIVGLIYFGEPATFYRILSVCLIVAGLAGLKLTGAHPVLTGHSA